MKKIILHKLTYAQNPWQYEVYPSYYEEILCKVLTVKYPQFVPAVLNTSSSLRTTRVQRAAVIPSLSSV